MSKVQQIKKTNNNFFCVYNCIKKHVFMNNLKLEPRYLFFKTALSLNLLNTSRKNDFF